ncbi:MAG: glycosyltransferase family 2 protein [Bacteroidia bacterium]
MNKPKVAIVIIHWNNRHLLETFLPGVLKSTYPNLDIFLADNASSDDSVAYVKENFPAVKIIQLDKNYGYAGGYNEALKHVEADYFILLNNDVAVDPDWIEPVIAAMEADANIAAAQPKLLQFKEPEYFEYAGAAGGYIDHLGYVFCKGRIFETMEKDLGQYNESSQIFWASGACLFIKSKCFKEVNGFDADYFAHMEEVDLCWRLQLLNYKIISVPQSTVYHLGGSTLKKASPQKTYLNFRNSLIMLLKNMPLSQLWWFIPYRSFLDLLSSIFFLINEEPRHSWAIHRAHADFFFRFSFWWKKRAEVKRLCNPLKSNVCYRGSIVFAHFIRRKKNFSEINF